MNNSELQTDPLPEWLKGLESRLAGQIKVRYLKSVGSTNTWLKEQLAAGSICSESCARPIVLFTDHQTAGRGTRGRTWHQPGAGEAETGLDLAVSIALPRQAGLLSDQRLSLLVAALILRSLKASLTEQGLAEKISLATKWPNDILGLTPEGWRKLGGILIETRQLQDGSTCVVIGVGLNINSRAVDFPPELAGQVTTMRDLIGSVYAEAHSANRAVVAMHLLEDILNATGEVDGDPDTLMQEWLASHQTLDREYMYKLAGQAIPVRATGVDSNTGALIVADARGNEHRVISYTDLAELPED